MRPEERTATHTLAELAAGGKAEIVALRGQGLIRRRLLDLGFVPGTVVQAILPSPFGDPIAFSVRGSVVAIRKEDANSIEVRILNGSE